MNLAAVYLAIFQLSNVYAKELLQKHTTRPFQAEGMSSALEPWETPITGFFVRSHHPVPNVNETNFVIKVDGLVDKELELSIADLKRMHQVSFHSVLECSGNGRKFHSPTVPGVQWERGAVGNAQWTGVPLADILMKAGIKKGAHFVRLEGADKPAFPTTPGFIRSIPIEKALEKNSLLALEMNREPLPLLQGGPVRVVLPNWYGENWMKWVNHITVTEKEDSGFYMKTAYRLPTKELKPGEPWDPTSGIPVEQVKVQSILVAPQGEVPIGNIVVKGKAFSGAGVISKVEISTDKGKNWKPASLEAPHRSGGWQGFEYAFSRMAPGVVTVFSRATDIAGNTQPLKQSWNPGGYVKNSVDQLTFHVSKENFTAAHEILQDKCFICHSSEMVLSQRLTSAQWEKELKKMEGFGAHISENEKATVIKYLSTLAKTSPPQTLRLADFSVEEEQLTSARLLRADAKHGKKLYATSCAACHGERGEGKTGPRLFGRAISSARFNSVVMEGMVSMPSFAESLKPQDVLDIHKFVAEMIPESR